MPVIPPEEKIFTPAFYNKGLQKAALIFIAEDAIKCFITCCTIKTRRLKKKKKKNYTFAVGKSRRCLHDVVVADVEG